MRRHTPSLLASLLMAGSIPLQAAETHPKPNVLLLISDDQGFGDFGFNGNSLVKTPNLDHLAGESAVFRNFIVAPACSPTRAAILTGRNHLLTGVWGVPPRANLLPDEARMPAFFKASGYRTLHVGKIDCARMGKDSPSAFGWDDWLCGGGYEHRDPMIFQAGNNRRGEGWTVEIWTDYAIDFIRTHRDEPWFASVAFIIPHMPWVCDEKYSAPFVALGCSKDLADCYGSIAQMDECIGRILDALRETGQAERTIVAFVSDNGPTSPESKQAGRDGFVVGADWNKRNVAKLRGHKSLVWENGNRVPLLLRWPGRFAPGERKQLGCAEDILPTLLDLSGVKTDAVPHQPFTGLSLRPSLQDAAASFDRPGIFRMAIAGPGSPAGKAAQAVRRKFEEHHLTLRGPRFKYHALPKGRSALFDLEADPGEVADVQARFPEVAAQMAAECRQRWEEVITSGRSFIPPPDDPQEPEIKKE